MPIIFACHDCGQAYKRPSKDAGKKAHCAKCQTELIVPAKTQEQVAAALASSPVPPLPRKHTASNSPVPSPASVIRVAKTNTPLLLLVASGAFAVGVFLGWLATTATSPTQAVAENRQPIAVKQVPKQDRGLGYSLREHQELLLSTGMWKENTNETNDRGEVIYQVDHMDHPGLNWLVSGKPEDLDIMAITFTYRDDVEEDYVLSSLKTVSLVLSDHGPWTEEDIALWWMATVNSMPVGSGSLVNVERDDYSLTLAKMNTGESVVITTMLSGPREASPVQWSDWIKEHPIPVK